MAIPIFLVDAFTQAPFQGNPAAVCLLESPAENQWMQAVAAEMNLSETAFVVAQGEDFQLRWFTPIVEVQLCGHATLASAHAIWEAGSAPLTAALNFHTASGPLCVRRRGAEIEMDFPLRVPQPCAPPAELLASLGVEQATYVGRDVEDYLVIVEQPAILRGLQPNFARLAELDQVRGTIVSSRSDDPRFDFLSRFFAPAQGINEDPVTGSAHCCLASYWGEELGKTQLVGSQVSRRGGVVSMQIAGKRVMLSGRAVTIARGELLA